MSHRFVPSIKCRYKLASTIRRFRSTREHLERQGKIKRRTMLFFLQTDAKRYTFRKVRECFNYKKKGSRNPRKSATRENPLNLKISIWPPSNGRFIRFFMCPNMNKTHYRLISPRDVRYDCGESEGERGREKYLFESQKGKSIATRAGNHYL